MKKPILNDKFAESAKRREKESAQKKVLNQDEKNGQTSTDPISIYLETGSKRTLASALAWPGWCRGGRDEAEALQALLAYAPRYAGVAKAAKLPFPMPQTVADFVVVARLTGGSATDFGVPGVIPAGDAEAVSDEELARLNALLDGCDQAFQAAIDAASSHELRKGPRGGGRDVAKMMQHVLDSGAGYLHSLGWKLKLDDDADIVAALRQNRQVRQDALAAAAQGEIDPAGPRGGKRWPPRYYARRAAWHILDHAWEIEDRILA